MSRELAILYQVQELDTELAKLRAALAGLETGDELKAEITAGEAELVEVLHQLHAAEAESRAVELETKSLQEKKANFEGQLYGGTVRNPRQLEDLQNEVAMLAREGSKLDDRMLELMETVEGLRADRQAREADLAAKRERLVAVLAAYQANQARLTAELATVEAQRKEQASQVEPSLLKRYDAIRLRQGNLGIVRANGDNCAGCRVALASETMKELRQGRIGLTCDNCGRILYKEEPEDWEEGGD